MIRFLFYLSFIVVYEGIQAQNHDYVWVLSRRLQLDFNFDPPKIRQEDLGLDIAYATASFSDSSGKRLLFYTNGAKIFSGIDRKVMEGGDSVNFNWGAVTFWYEHGYISSPPVILPLPNSNKYYIFHYVADVHPVLPHSLYYPFFLYHLIDMDANGGRGKVIEKNKIIMAGDPYHSELSPIACVKHANGRDWWIALTKSYDPNLYTFLLCPEGLKGPYLQEISPPERRGYLVFSNKGKFLVKFNRDVLRFYSFDRCSGRAELIRSKSFDGTNLTIPLWAIFTHDDRFLYLQRVFWTLQVDVEAFINTGVIHYGDKQFWELNYHPTFWCDTRNWIGQLAPNNKIYFTLYGPCGSCLNAINRPTLPGDAADIEEEAIDFYSPSAYVAGINIYGIPNYRLSKWEGSPCDTLGVQRGGEIARDREEPRFFSYSESGRMERKEFVAGSKLIKAVAVDEPDDIYEHYYRLMQRAGRYSGREKGIDNKNGSTHESTIQMQLLDGRPKD